MQEAIDAADIDECTVLGEIFDRSVYDIANVDLAQSLGLLNIDDLVCEHLARENDIVPAAAEFDDLGLDILTDVCIKPADRTRIDLRTGQKSFDSVKVYAETTFGLINDPAGNRGLGLKRCLDLIPNLSSQGVDTRELRCTITRVDRANNDLERLADRRGHLAVRSGKLFERNKTLGFVAKINQHTSIGHADNGPRNKFARMENGLFLFELFQDRTKVDLARTLSVVSGVGCRSRRRCCRSRGRCRCCFLRRRSLFGRCGLSRGSFGCLRLSLSVSGLWFRRRCFGCYLCGGSLGCRGCRFWLFIRCFLDRCRFFSVLG